MALYNAEGNQERIVEAGGLTSLLMLLRSFDDETICRVAAGAIANLAMNGKSLLHLSLSLSLVLSQTLRARGLSWLIALPLVI